MFAYGLSAPPQIIPSESIYLAGVTAATALPTMADGSDWGYVMVSTDSVGSVSFAFGDSGVAVATDPWGWLTTDSGPQIFNVSGQSHYATSAGAFCITPIGKSRGSGSMLNAPAQISTSSLTTVTTNGVLAIPKSGTHPTKYILLSHNNSVGQNFSVGLSTADARAIGGLPNLMFGREAGAVLLNVSGQTHVAYEVTTSTDVLIAVLSC